MRKVVAIDPGMTGCIVVMDAETNDYVAHLQMPAMKVGTKNRVNGAEVARFLHEHAEIEHAFIERVQAMSKGDKKQGVTSMFSFGMSAGIVEGVVQGLMIPYTLVTPQAWKSHSGLVGADKDASRGRAIQLFPRIKDLSLKGKGQALGDAMMIALYGMEKFIRW